MRIDHVEMDDWVRAIGLTCIACSLAASACATGQSIEAGSITPLFIDAGRDAHGSGGTGGTPEGNGGGPSSTTGGVTSSGGSTGSGGRAASSGGARTTGGRTGEETPDGSIGGMDSGAGGTNTGGAGGAGGANTAGASGSGGANTGGANTGGTNTGGAGGAGGAGGSQSACDPNRCPSCLISGLLGASCCKSNDTCGCRPILGLLPCN